PDVPLTLAELADWKRAKLVELKNYHLPPSVLIDTGNGLASYYFLGDLALVTKENAGDLTAINLKLAQDIAGDTSAANLAPTMRLPFTINIPYARKLELKRAVAPTELLLDDRDLIQFALHEFARESFGESQAETASAYADIGSPDIPASVDLSKLAA